MPGPGSVEERLERLEAAMHQAVRERDQYKKLCLLLQEENERLKRGLLGQKAERLPKNDAQLTLAIMNHMLAGQEQEQQPTEADDETSEVKPHKRRKRTGRKPIPEHIPRIDIEVIPQHILAEGLDNFERIGEDVSEVLEHRPSSTVVARTIRPKFARKQKGPDGATDICVAPPPELPIERGLAGPGFMAATIVRRWDEHQPLHRQSRSFGREGLEVARSTMCSWHIMLAELCQPLIEAMLEDAKRQPYLCTDATGVLVQAPQKCRNGHFWVLVAPGRHVLFRFTTRHNSEAVDGILGDYQGYLVADAHVVYDHLYEPKGGSAIEVACWSHARRYYFKALDSDPERARHALAVISALFRIERSIATAPRKKRERTRLKKSKPLVTTLMDWCDVEIDAVLDHTPIKRAITYMRNQREALSRFLEDGRLPLHNNISEGELRREALGRNNWIFVGSPDGALANTTFVSLLASCRMAGVEPWAYLRDLFCLLPSWPKSRVLELAPINWKQTLEQQDTQQRLAANVYRRVVLGAGNHTMISRP